MNKKVSLGVTLALVVVAVALTISVTMVIAMRYFSTMVSDVGQQKAMYDFINAIDKAARQNYTIDEGKLRDALAAGYIDGLGDPYAAYLTAGEYQQLLARQNGSITGLGVDVAATPEGELAVTLVHDNSPAAQAGIERNDVLAALDGNPVAAKHLETVREQLATADKAMLTIRRGGQNLAVELTANTFVTKVVEGRKIGRYGYIVIYDFNGVAARQFEALYASLRGQGVEGFIFDVRHASSGTKECVKEMLAYLMPYGVFARYEDKSGRQDWTADGGSEMTLPSVTLVGENTVGEAELFAAVLQEFHKTTVVGSSTKGKATVQGFFTISADNAVVRLTVGQYRLVSGAPLQVKPDVELPLTAEQQMYLLFLPDDQDPQKNEAVRLLDETGGRTTMPTTTPTTESTTAPTTPSDVSSESTADAA